VEVMIPANELTRATKRLIAALDAKDRSETKAAASALIAVVLEVSASTDPVGDVIVFPCAGAVKDWPFSAAEIAKLRSAFPALDVVGEARKARAWILSAPQNRKTAHGMARFLYRWMARAQESGRGMKAAGSVMPKTSDPRIRSGRWCSFHRVKENAGKQHPMWVKQTLGTLPSCDDCETIYTNSNPDPWPEEA
jgi:hypothetical protein